MSTLQVTALQNASGAQEVSQTTLFSGTAKAWSNLSGTGTIFERDSFNVSSYTDNGTGDYTYTLSNNMNNINYQAGMNSTHTDNAGNEDVGVSSLHGSNGGTSPIATGSLHVSCTTHSSPPSLVDSQYALMSINGDLA